MPPSRGKMLVQGHAVQEARGALIVVDIQRDFCPGGALPVADGDKIIPAVNELVRAFEKAGLPVFFTRDWHPRNHVSFKSNGGPWPPHCVQNTPGASFHQSLAVPAGAEVIDKGTLQSEDAYSGFQGTDLARKLHNFGVKRIYVAGLATDYCVKNTVLDGAAQGFETYVLTDCVRGVNLKRTDSATALRAMLSRGARKTTSGRTPEKSGLASDDFASASLSSQALEAHDWRTIARMARSPARSASSSSPSPHASWIAVGSSADPGFDGMLRAGKPQRLKTSVFWRRRRLSLPASFPSTSSTCGATTLVVGIARTSSPLRRRPKTRIDSSLTRLAPR